MIYVDELAFMRQGKLFCHMATDGDIDELHAMAKKMGLKRGWFQAKRKPHYDLTYGMRCKAVFFGAQEVDTKELIKLCFRKDNHG